MSHRVSKGLLLALLLLIHVPGLIQAQPEPPETACVLGSEAHAASVARLARFEEKLSRLAPGGSVAELRAAYEALIEGVCYRGTDVRDRGPRVESALGIREWGRAGGLRWLRTYVEGFPSVSGRSSVVIPPDERRALTRESAPDHSLRSLLCPAADEGCGGGTRMWIERAEAAFRAQRDMEDESRRSGAEDPVLRLTREERIARCADTLKGVQPEQRYRVWYDCVYQERERYTALPLGRFRVPRRGWLVIRGRRGHYGFCDEARAYDLATGAAYIVSSCSRLVLRRHGSVDGNATDRGRERQVTRGRLPIDNVREAAFMLLMSPHVERAVTLEAQYIDDVPEGLERSWDRQGTFEVHFPDIWVTSAQTTLAWTYIVSGRVRASGALTWPNSHREEQSHAARLLHMAEAGLEPGCPPRALPQQMPIGPNRPGVSPLDAEPNALRQREGSLLDELIHLDRGPDCPSAD